MERMIDTEVPILMKKKSSAKPKLIHEWPRG